MCIIVYLKNPNDKSIIISKNRDRNYKPKIEIIHELINGVEVAYMRDYYTNWTEGLNEHGFGIINASLQVDYDENPMNASPHSMELNLKSQKKYLNALSKNSFNDFINELFNPDYYMDIGLQGHTIAANPYFGFHIESMTNAKPHIQMLKDYHVSTNHGDKFSNTGYTHGKPLLSSIIRQRLIEDEIVKCYDYITKFNTKIDIFDIMNRNYSDLDIDLHPYRNNPKYFFTTSQIQLDLTNRILIFNYDSLYSTFDGIKNNLPKDYIPKIKIKIRSTYKKPHIVKNPIKKIEMDNLMKKYNYKP
jgi:hypothetical protein